MSLHVRTELALEGILLAAERALVGLHLDAGVWVVVGLGMLREDGFRKEHFGALDTRVAPE